MPRRPLNNYIKTHRKRLGLSQDELALLIGAAEGATVSRYESGRLPSLETAIALSRIFGVSVESLFFGEVLRVESLLAQRVHVLAERIGKETLRADADWRSGILAEIAERAGTTHHHEASPSPRS